VSYKSQASKLHVILLDFFYFVTDEMI